MGSERRTAKRKEVTPLMIDHMVSLENFAKISNSGQVIDASTTGFCIQVKHENLVPKSLRNTLTLDTLIGTKVLLHLTAMNLELTGKIARTKLVGKKTFEIAIDFTSDAPQFWRECLVDLLPAPGEMDGEEL